ncbi:MAG TPA: 6,7-dimethyl-8-ribityllumazine synthase [Thermoanaerobaculia bacterium]|nr:6,7-dimethyl-8-ribityllumazine synthase [Thermoanaerobaculia bacterium]
MVRSFEGHPNAGSLRFALVASRFNDEIVTGLLGGARECLSRHGASDDDVAVYRVPGAFEIPLLAAKLIDTRMFDAVIALGCLLRGDTPHFEFLAAAVTSELSRISVDSRIPIAFGVITCETMEQAEIRSGPGAGNKGWEAALAAIEMVNLFREAGL